MYYIHNYSIFPSTLYTHGHRLNQVVIFTKAHLHTGKHKPSGGTANYCTFGKRDTNTIWAVTLAGRIFAVVGDLLVLFVTWFQTYASYRGQQGALEGPSLTRAMLYNGAYSNISRLASAHGVDTQGAHISCESSS